MGKEIFSIKEAANYIGISLSTLYRWENFLLISEQLGCTDAI